ncbi:hypothetical protein E2605_11870 [Dysgonomonas capnocytophagoides]|uniref:Uncharacterized protein n=1 Tax=Dysgonomonas capnocytophagoides TaxID=45254 RepID=A0A4Y8KZW6_9BACT|nr:hypothetical protein [Dysgonomonas capnocytophagoides]TFD95537.1 hypothetical protein E2605_11870 [Dysgonomonas capnocytophagoides]
MENERKEEKSLKTQIELNAKNKRLKLHFIYVSIIFSAVIVAILSLHFYSDNLNSKFVGYAATISSLILSVLAIIITVISNDSTNGLMHKIRDIYEAISATPEKISDSVECITHASESLDNSVKSIRGISDKIEELSTAVNNNLSKIELLHESLPDKITNDLNTLILSQSGNKRHVDSYAEDKNSVNYNTVSDVKIDFNNYIDNTSHLGFIILYAVYVAYAKKKKLDLVKLADAIVLPGQEIDKDYAVSYFHGYFVSLVCIQGLIEHGIEANSTFKILNFNNELADVLIKKESDRFIFIKKDVKNLFPDNLQKCIDDAIIKD